MTALSSLPDFPIPQGAVIPAALCLALERTYDGQPDTARLYLSQLSDDELRAARTQLQRLANFADEVRFTRPELPQGVDGFKIGGRQ